MHAQKALNFNVKLVMEKLIQKVELPYLTLTVFLHSLLRHSCVIKFINRVFHMYLTQALLVHHENFPECNANHDTSTVDI